MDRYFHFGLALFLFLFAGSGLQAQATNPDYSKQLDKLYKYSVPLLTPDELDGMVKEGEEILILDTREAQEYNVSHIPGAKLVEFGSFKKKDWEDQPKNQKVIVYCSVGYRSERIGESLKSLGFDEVYNLYGGIFEWVNQGHEVVNPEGKETPKVHTYNKEWGKWLEKGEKVW